MQAAEIEFPFEGNRQEAKKFAYQVTFNDENEFKDGFQMFGEFFIGEFLF